MLSFASILTWLPRIDFPWSSFITRRNRLALVAWIYPPFPRAGSFSG